METECESSESKDLLSLGVAEILSKRATPVMEIQGRGSIVVRLLVKVNACLLKNSLVHTRSMAWFEVNESLRSDDIYIDLLRRNTTCSLQLASSLLVPCVLQYVLQ